MFDCGKCLFVCDIIMICFDTWYDKTLGDQAENIWSPVQFFVHKYNDKDKDKDKGKDKDKARAFRNNQTRHEREEEEYS